MNLLFAHADDGSSYLDDRPDPSSAAGEVTGKVPVREETHLADVTASADDLERQGWAVIAPEGAAGDALIGHVRPLIDKRAADQDAPVEPIRVPPGLDTAAALEWKQRTYPESWGGNERKRPRYLLILGDMDGVSLATQQALAIDGFPGRLACAGERGYKSYVEKVLKWEREPSEQDKGRALFYTVHDGTDATRLGYEGLVKPCYDLCEREGREAPRRFPASQVLDQGSRTRPDAGELLDLAEERYPSVLFSLSHGMGPPRRRDWTPAEARALQGAMHFGGGEEPLVPSELAESSFLPGGLWFYFACFGAGTPSRSAYYHWLRMLEQNGMTGLGHLQDVLRGLSAGGGFTSGLAQAALANPKGPLAVVGHIDLAWSYGFEELRVHEGDAVRGTSQVQNFFQLVQHLLARDKYSGAPGRLGAAMLKLRLPLGRVNTELNNRYDTCKQRGIDPEGASEAERLALGHLWMLRQDLSAYVLLGDPAVRLPLAVKDQRAGRGRRAGFMAGFGGGAGAERGGAGRERGGAAGPEEERARRMEEAILARAAGKRTWDDVGAAFGGRRSDAKRWEEAYREAGRQALARLLRGEGK